MTTKPEKRRVSLIHASADREYARRLARYIERLPNVDVMLSGDITVTAGDAMIDALKTQIHHASGALFLLTPDSLDSEWAMLELGMARGSDKPVHVLQGGSVPLRIPVDVGSHTSIDAQRLENPEVVQQLLSSFPTSAEAREGR